MEPSVIKVDRSAHLRALRRSAILHRPVSPPGPPSLGRPAVDVFAGPTVEDVAIMAARAVVALQEDGGSTPLAIKRHIETNMACDVPDNALTGALRKPAFVEHAPGRFGMVIAPSAAAQRPPAAEPPLTRPSPGATAGRKLRSRLADRPLNSRAAAPNGDWWRTPVHAARPGATAKKSAT